MTKNSDMPAMPSSVSNSDGCVEDSNVNGYGYGLTKREHFAGLAPEMPEWFESSFTVDLSDIDSPIHTKEEIRLSNEYRSDNYGLSELDFKIGSRVSGELYQYTQEIESERIRKSYFAWRSYYADQLLAELENETN